MLRATRKEMTRLERPVTMRFCLTWTHQVCLLELSPQKIAKAGEEDLDLGCW
jgi:hypothetical protein